MSTNKRVEKDTRIAVEESEVRAGEFHNTNLFDANDGGRDVDESTGEAWDTSGGR